MSNTKSVGNVENGGSTRQPLPRLNPREIAVLVLPGLSVTVEYATDEQFQRFVTAHDLHIAEDESEEWSFDDRCRLINHCRKHGLDLFALPYENSSAMEQKQFPNNSDGELFEAKETAPQAS